MVSSVMARFEFRSYQSWVCSSVVLSQSLIASGVISWLIPTKVISKFSTVPEICAPVGAKVLLDAKFVGEAVAVTIVSCSVGDCVSGSEGAEESISVIAEEGTNDGDAVVTAVDGGCEATPSATVGDMVESVGAPEGPSDVSSVGFSVGAKVTNGSVGEPVVAVPVGASVGSEETGDAVSPCVGNIVVNRTVGDTVVVAIDGAKVGGRVSGASVSPVDGAPVTNGSVDRGGEDDSWEGGNVVL